MIELLTTECIWSLGTRGYGMGIAATGNWMFSKISHNNAETFIANQH